jgi:LmbE family N-acetylglucosaminyl deacetylase
MSPGASRYTLVAFHAHPDDEVLLTGGTLAKAAAAGHRVVLVTATLGERGLAGSTDGSGEQLAGVRRAELQASAAALRCERVVCLGYADSGLTPEASAQPDGFAAVDVEEAARKLAAVLGAEHADVLTVYDANGGYGHPDHIQVHRVGTRAAELASTPVVLAATAPAEPIRAALAALRLVRHPLGRSAPLGTEAVFTPRGHITHRISVRRHLAAKRAALAAHGSQRRGGTNRVFDALLRLPAPLFALAFGREWYVERGRAPRPVQSDVFASLRDVNGHSRQPTA